MFACELCPKKLSSKGSLNQHVREVHEGVKNYACGHCQRAFNRRSDLRRHVECVHNEVRGYVCDICRRAFSRKFDLNRHIKDVHLRIRGFICDRCGLAFSQKGNLDRHVNDIHENPLPKAISRGESMTHSFLTGLGIKFETEKTFLGLRGSQNGLLRYDVAIPGPDGSFLLIEYDGPRHFHPVRYSRKQTDADVMKQFVTTKLHDKAKDEFAMARGCPMLRIAYYDPTSWSISLGGSWLNTKICSNSNGQRRSRGRNQ